MWVSCGANCQNAEPALGHLRVEVSDGVHVVRPEVGLEAGLAVDHEVLVVLIPRAAVIIVNRERWVVVRDDCAQTIQGGGSLQCQRGTA